MVETWVFWQWSPMLSSSSRISLAASLVSYAGKVVTVISSGSWILALENHRTRQDSGSKHPVYPRGCYSGKEIRACCARQAGVHIKSQKPAVILTCDRLMGSPQRIAVLRCQLIHQWIPQELCSCARLPKLKASNGGTRILYASWRPLQCSIARGNYPCHWTFSDCRTTYVCIFWDI